MRTFKTPTAECSVEIELATTSPMPAIPTFEILQPITRYVDSCRKKAGCDTSSNEDKPYLTGIP